MGSFGRRGGVAAAIAYQRRALGNAQPMQNAQPPMREAADSEAPSADPLVEGAPDIPVDNLSDAMNGLSERESGAAEPANSKHEGFEASIHKIKEQVLPRLLERVDPEAAATLSKDELSEEFRPIIVEVLAELKLTLNRREQIALEKVLVDELLWLGPLDVLLAYPEISVIMLNGPDQTFIALHGKLEIAQIQ